jgi:hypothetical protein
VTVGYLAIAEPPCAALVVCGTIWAISTLLSGWAAAVLIALAIAGYGCWIFNFTFDRSEREMCAEKIGQLFARHRLEPQGHQ